MVDLCLSVISLAKQIVPLVDVRILVELRVVFVVDFAMNERAECRTGLVFNSSKDQ